MRILDLNDCFDIKLTDDELRDMSSLALAHVGDAVYELLVRAYVCRNGEVTSNAMHLATVSYVSAGAQAHAMTVIEPLLSPEELTVYKRGRNAHVNSVPHGSTIGEYHAATGLETLFGWLYLSGRRDRIGVLFAAAMDGVNGDAS